MTTLLNTAASAPPIDLPADITRLRVLSGKATAEFLGLSVATLERMDKLGTGPRRLVLSPRRIGYRICDLIAWLDARAAENGEAA